MYFFFFFFRKIVFDLNKKSRFFMFFRKQKTAKKQQKKHYLKKYFYAFFSKIVLDLNKKQKMLQPPPIYIYLYNIHGHEPKIWPITLPDINMFEWVLVYLNSIHVIFSAIYRSIRDQLLIKLPKTSQLAFLNVVPYG